MRTFYEIRSNDLSVQSNKVDIDCPNHIHEDFELLHMRSGTQNVIIDGKKYTLNAGDTAVILPNIPHKYFYAEKQYPANELIIICSYRFYGAFFPKMDNLKTNNPIIKSTCLNDNIRIAVNEIEKTSDFTLRTAWALIIISYALNNTEMIHRESFPIDNIYYKIIKYIDTNYDKPLTLEILAKEFSISKNSVSRLFSDKLDVNFRRYLGAVRAERAVSLMRNTNKSITTIASDVGFESQSTFNRIFKDIYGITPKAFRIGLKNYTSSEPDSVPKRFV